MQQVLLPAAVVAICSLTSRTALAQATALAEPPTAVAAKSLPTADAASVGMSSDKLSEVRGALQGLVDEEKIPGAIVVVARRGKVVLFESVGYRDIENEVAMEHDSVLRFYSMTKPVTSVAIMMLVEQGKIGLDEPASTYLEELKGLKVFVKEGEDGLELEDAREMTVRDLLRHTSGLTYGIFGDTPVDREYRKSQIMSGSLDVMAEKLGKLPLLSQPGEKFTYSLSTDVLGLIVERISGTTLDVFFKQNIFEPLGMVDTGFQVAAETQERFANNYGPRTFRKGLRVVDDAKASPFLRTPKRLSGGGGLVSTANDYIRFCQMLVNKGELEGKRLLTAATVQEMTRNHLPKKAYPIQLGGTRWGVGFGLGFSVVVESTEANRPAKVGEYGWGGAASTHFWISPEDELAVVALTQHMPFNFLVEDTVKPIVYEALLD